MQKVHTHSETIRNIEESDYNVSKIECILNKANAYLYMSCVILYAGVLVFFARSCLILLNFSS